MFSLSGGLGEATTGGPQLNIIGKQGGNTFAGSFFINGSGSAFVNDNLSAEQRAKGLSAPLKPKKLWDINPSFGGPIKRDRLWFFGSYRYQRNLQTVASMWDNMNAGDNTKWTYDSGFHHAIRRRRRMEEPFRPSHLAGDAAQQDRRLDGPALSTACTATPAVRAPASPSPVSSPRGRRCRETRTTPAA